MLFISKQGYVDAERVEIKIFPAIERGPMDKVNGIVVHQTDGSTANSSFNSYMKLGANGAHFLIDKDGTIYQTASIRKRTNHVGLLRSRCLLTHKCTSSEFNIASSMKGQHKKLSRHEHGKKFPNRYPGNADSIGIEIVGRMNRKTEIYETVNDKQNKSLKWLMHELLDTLNFPANEIYRHSEISYKMETEAQTAKWN
jgi:N-acetyl-anhydromuramyl-L-alanine amidase AmpD